MDFHSDDKNSAFFSESEQSEWQNSTSESTETMRQRNGIHAMSRNPLYFKGHPPITGYDVLHHRRGATRLRCLNELAFAESSFAGPIRKQSWTNGDSGRKVLTIT
jgi:hypothetical protein